MLDLVKCRAWILVAILLLACVVSAKVITLNEEEFLNEEYPVGSFEVQTFFDQQASM